MTSPHSSSTDDEMFPELLFQLFWSFFNLSLCFLAAVLLTRDQEVLLAGSPHKINVNIVIAILVTIWITTISTLVLFWATGIKDAITIRCRPPPRPVLRTLKILRTRTPRLPMRSEKI